MPDGIAAWFNKYPDPATAPTYTAADERLLSTALAAPSTALLARPGVRLGGGLAVTVAGTPEAASIAPGGGIITDSAGGGSFIFVIPSTVAINLATRPAAGTSRIDEVVAVVKNDEVRPADGAREVDLQVITGTAGSSPSAPTIPAGALRLAELAVPASGSVSVSKPPPRIAAAGGIPPTASQSERDAIDLIYDGLMIYREDVDYFEGRINGDWKRLSIFEDTGWVNLTPHAVFTSGTLRYRRRGDTVFAQVDGAANTTSGTAITLTTSQIPTALRPGVQVRGGGYFGGYAGVVTAGTDGNLTAVQISGGTRGSVAATLSWPVEA